MNTCPCIFLHIRLVEVDGVVRVAYNQFFLRMSSIQDRCRLSAAEARQVIRARCST
jgi:hypothetical protein